MKIVADIPVNFARICYLFFVFANCFLNAYKVLLKLCRPITPYLEGKNQHFSVHIFAKC